MRIREKFSSEYIKRQVIVEGQVVPEAARCVQCGICSYYCPIGIDIRRHAWLNIPIIDSHCLTCGECIARCPRAVLKFEKSNIFATQQDDLKNLNNKGLQKEGEHV